MMTKNSVRVLRRRFTTIALVMLALGAGGVYVLAERAFVSTSESVARKHRLIIPWRREDISELSVVGRDIRARVERLKHDDQRGRPWTLVLNGEPAPLDSQAFDQLLGTLEWATVERAVQGGNERDLGLDDPIETLSLRIGTRTEQVRIGGAVATREGARYVEVTGRGVFVITAETASALEQAVKHLSGRDAVSRAGEHDRLIRLRLDEIIEVRIEAGTQILDLSRQESGWHERAPVDVFLAPDKVQPWLQALVDATGNPGQPNPERPSTVTHKVRILSQGHTESGADEQTTVLQLVQDNEGRAFARDGTTGETMGVSSEVVERFDPSRLAALQ